MTEPFTRKAGMRCAKREGADISTCGAACRIPGSCVEERIASYRHELDREDSLDLIAEAKPAEGLIATEFVDPGGCAPPIYVSSTINASASTIARLEAENARLKDDNDYLEGFIERKDMTIEAYKNESEAWKAVEYLQKANAILREKLQTAEWDLGFRKVEIERLERDLIVSREAHDFLLGKAKASEAENAGLRDANKEWADVHAIVLANGAEANSFLDYVSKDRAATESELTSLRAKVEELQAALEKIGSMLKFHSPSEEIDSYHSEFIIRMIFARAALAKSKAPTP